MYPGLWAKRNPDSIAAIDSVSGESVSYAQLDENSNRLARYFHDQGIRRGDRICIFLDNDLRFFEIAWAAQRSGLYVVTINRYLTTSEVAYIVQDSGASAIVSSAAIGTVADDLPKQADCRNCEHFLYIGDPVPEGYKSYTDALASSSPEPLVEQWLGSSMLYSSGTTGKPKGIIRPLPNLKITDLPSPSVEEPPYYFGQSTIYLSTAPLYHAAPFGFTRAIQSVGGTVVVMPRFDALDALRCIEEFKVTHSQWVPTMFIRMLKLPEEERQRYDLSSQRCAIHAAAPCPVEIKRSMIEWWGPIVEEYYAGTEGNGSTRISSEEWLQHPGSVGKAATNPIHICNDDGEELGSGEVGLVYFEQPQTSFRYHNDPQKTREALHVTNTDWSTLGDVGYLDEEGYLYLTDRKTFMIVSGGVNIYPQAIEDTLVTHRQVLDVAVFGVPNEDFGEEVKAVVQLVDGADASKELEQELISYCKSRIASYMAPRSIDFIDELPRLPTGKLYKRILRDSYWGKSDSKII